MKADKDGDQVQHNPEHHGNHLHVEEGKDEVKLNPERHDDHLQGGKGEDQVQLPPETFVDHLHAEEGEYQFQHSPEHHDNKECLHSHWGHFQSKNFVANFCGNLFLKFLGKKQ